MSVQLLFSLKFFFKRWVMLLVMLVLFIVVPLTLVILNALASLEENWYSILQFQMIFVVLLSPILLHTIWKGQLQSFENKLILYHLQRPFTYFLGKLFAVWITVNSLLILFYTVFWLSFHNQIPTILWSTTILQIMLTTLFTIALAGFLSLLFKRTIYGVILFILYLIISIQFIRQPLLGLWFNPDYIQQVMLEPSFLIQRSILLCWSLLLLLASRTLFMRQVVQS